MKMNLLWKTWMLPSLFLVGFATVSCRKEAPTLAKIQVLDSNGTPCPGVAVRLFPEPTLTPHGTIVIDDLLYTDADGFVVFDYSDEYELGQSGFAVLNIEATSSDGLQFGEGIIKVEEERLNQETVIIQP